jgi:hypothetical protein
LRSRSIDELQGEVEPRHDATTGDDEEPGGAAVSGWCSLIAFVPYVGPFALLLWTGLAVPDHHGRSQWWSAALAFPGVNLIGYWFYAFTLPRQPELAPA